MNARKSLAITAVAAVAALGLAACSSNNSGTGATTPPAAGATTPAAGGAGTDSGTLTIWENNTTGTKGPAFWQTVKDGYAKVQPGVTLNIVPVQNEDLDGKLQTAMNGGTPPDVFLQRGGGKLADMVSAGFVADITSAVNAPDIPASAFAAHTLAGKKYAMPLTILPGGFFYSKDLFQQAGISTPPTTMDELNQAVTKLKGIGVAPIALGAQDAWPAAHWFYWLSLRECSQDTLEKAATTANLSDPCFLKAATDLQTFAATKPFNDGFLTTSAQKGAGSSAGLVANHKAAMELMGAWDPGVIGGLTPDQKNLPDLGFFPFVSVSGGAGDPSAMMAGVDAYSCSSKAPEPTCTDFLNYLGTTDVQSAYADANSAPPANTKAAAAVTDPVLQSVMSYSQKAAYVSLWLDTRLGQSIGNALNTGVVNMLAGNGTPQGIIDAANTAASKG
jgi:raffinose/stachyose/melibiose transport system substrate-binding protein